MLESSAWTADSNSMRSRVWAEWSEIAVEYGLSLLNLEHGVELRVPSRTRVEAVEAIISETHRSVPVAYLNDGVLSEFAFDGLGERGMRVLVRGTLRRTLADVWIRPPVGLVDLLKLWLNVGQQDHTRHIWTGSTDGTQDQVGAEQTKTRLRQELTKHSNRCLENCRESGQVATNGSIHLQERKSWLPTGLHADLRACRRKAHPSLDEDEPLREFSAKCSQPLIAAAANFRIHALDKGIET